ncbi:uncharacterized protein LOC131281751 [Anopheles ziemanni]|uniref:uncharacterized protein LOC131265723 n=1 Tax=Anopheles coustani TaxID=139045 RepID=UPI00265B3CDA|nr:uncharacterized protein LOC131265723 [Anopheles coustani]XP_058167082.1 uncharacterized protein LOC131281751 [Anopheles ziemanni]
MKQSTVCLLLVVLLCSSAVADALVYVYASTCTRCKSFGASYCGYGTPRKGVSCDGQTKIGSCDDCKRYGGRCEVTGITECYV